MIVSEGGLDRAQPGRPRQTRLEERDFKWNNDDGRLTVSELARSLHTDRPNLTRAIKAAQNDPSVKKRSTALTPSANELKARQAAAWQSDRTPVKSRGSCALDDGEVVPAGGRGAAGGEHGHSVNEALVGQSIVY